MIKKASSGLNVKMVKLCRQNFSHEILANTFFFFFNVGPPKEEIFSGHPLSPLFQSTLY